MVVGKFSRLHSVVFMAGRSDMAQIDDMVTALCKALLLVQEEPTGE